MRLLYDENQSHYKQLAAGNPSVPNPAAADFAARRFQTIKPKEEPLWPN